MKFLSFLLLLIIACPSKTKTEPLITYSFNKKTNLLTANINLPEGKHAYGPGEAIGMPVEMLISNLNKWELAEPANIPQGDEKNLIENEFEISAKLKNGKGPILGTIKIQMCTEDTCDRPKDYAFKVSL